MNLVKIMHKTLVEETTWKC